MADCLRAIGQTSGLIGLALVALVLLGAVALVKVADKSDIVEIIVRIKGLITLEVRRKGGQSTDEKAAESANSSDHSSSQFYLNVSLQREANLEPRQEASVPSLSILMGHPPADGL